MQTATQTVTLTAGQKAAATRRANREAAAHAMPALGFADAVAAVNPSDMIADVGVLAAIVGDGTAAAKLLCEFGSLGRVLAARHDHLARVASYAHATTLKAVQTAIVRTLRAETKARCVLSSWSTVLDYVRASMAGRSTEEFRVLFLDKRNQLISDEVMGVGTVDHVPVYPREVVSRALRLDASAMILVHNHPSGDPAPSRADIEMTKTIVDVAKPLGIAVHDHIIVGAEGHASLKGLRLM